MRALIDRFAGRLHACAYRVLGDRAAADDVVQDAFVRLLRQGTTIESTALTAWLYTVTLNRCRDLLRRTHRQIEGVSEQLPDAGPDPEHSVQQDERRRVVDAAVQRLPAEFRDAIALRFAAGLSYNEIADVLGCTLGTVSSRLSRGLRKLGEDLRAKGFTLENL